MKANYNVTGAARKALVSAISNITGDKAIYKLMPTCAYEIGDITVSKEGCVSCEDADKLDRLMHNLIADGFTPETAEAPAESASEDDAPQKQPTKALALPLPFRSTAQTSETLQTFSKPKEASSKRHSVLMISASPSRMTKSASLGLRPCSRQMKSKPTFTSLPPSANSAKIRNGSTPQRNRSKTRNTPSAAFFCGWASSEMNTRQSVRFS
jgi:hypothetical protein